MALKMKQPARKPRARGGTSQAAYLTQTRREHDGFQESTPFV
jgi:hypothetical protein